MRSVSLRSIPAQPEAATYNEDRDLFERVIPHTPFVVIYRYNARAEEITVLALFGQSENRDSFER